MFSINLPGQNSWPLGVPGADKRTATGLTLLTHIKYLGVNSPLHFISFRFRNSNYLTLLKIYCLSRQICEQISLRLKYLHNFFLFSFQKNSICLSSLQSIPKFFKTLLFLQNSSNAENVFSYPERPKQCLGANNCVPNLLRKLCGFYPTKKDKRERGELDNA